MDYSQSAVALTGLQLRKRPGQRRSVDTVDTILEGAAHILESRGLDGYNTNAIAERSGVSIGSLYQYFPSKDAITVALIEREATALVDEVRSALLDGDSIGAMTALTQVAVDHQLRRPGLARLLDFEQDRLAATIPASSNAAAVLEQVRTFLAGQRRWRLDDTAAVAVSIVTIVRAMTDAAGKRPTVDADRLRRSIEGAVLGYLAAVELAPDVDAHSATLA